MPLSVTLVMGFEAIYQRGITAVFSTNRVAVPFSEARFRAKEDLVDTSASIARLLEDCWMVRYVLLRPQASCAVKVLSWLMTRVRSRKNAKQLE